MPLQQAILRAAVEVSLGRLLQRNLLYVDGLRMAGRASARSNLLSEIKSLKMPDANRLTHLFGFTNRTGARSRPAIVLRITDIHYLKLVVMFFCQLDVGWKSYRLRRFKRLVELF